LRAGDLLPEIAISYWRMPEADRTANHRAIPEIHGGDHEGTHGDTDKVGEVE
jgi:hypothetical protein